MTIEETPLQGCYILTPTVYEDSRGYFYESFNEKRFRELTDFKGQFVQDNQSYSTKGVLRGLHYQKGEFAQAKLVRVISGRVLDVALDLRKDSNSFGKHFSIELTSENKKQLFIPRGFGHGFSVLSETAELFYKCDNFYNKDSEGGIFYNDSGLNIDWQLPVDLIKVSQKDMELPILADAL